MEGEIKRRKHVYETVGRWERGGRWEWKPTDSPRQTLIKEVTDARWSNDGNGMCSFFFFFFPCMAWMENSKRWKQQRELDVNWSTSIFVSNVFISWTNSFEHEEHEASARIRPTQVPQCPSWWKRIRWSPHLQFFFVVFFKVNFWVLVSCLLSLSLSPALSLSLSLALSLHHKIPQSYVTAISLVQYLAKCFTASPSPADGAARLSFGGEHTDVTLWLERERRRGTCSPERIRAVESVLTASSLDEWVSGTTEALACCLSYQSPPTLPPTHREREREMQGKTHGTY